MKQMWQMSGVSLLLLLIPALAVAEGTAQLIPAGSASDCRSYVQGNDGLGKEGPSYSQDTTEYLFVHIADPLNETIYFGFTKKEPSSKAIYYQILDPDGTILCSGRVAESSSDSGYVADDGVAAYVGPTRLTSSAGGYTALECSPTVAGDYMIRFNVSDPVNATPSESRYYIHPLDITVGNTSTNTPVNGRLFAYRWHLNTTSSSRKACMQFYTWTPDSLVIMMDMNGMQPYGYTVSFNSFGVTHSGDIASDRQSSAHTNASIPEYKVFLNEPDSTAYPTGTPGEIEYIDINGCQIDSSFCILANTTKVGEMNVYIDLDGNGVYDSGGRDVYFPYANAETGIICIPWDGLDGEGNPVALDESGTVTVEFLAGVVHYPVYDPENNVNGFTCAIIRPTSGLSPLMYFDNSQTSIGTLNLDGCDSLCNIWTGSSGDKIMVNTWINTITSQDTEAFTMSGFCPPVAETDSACTRPSLAIAVPILSNDWDRDNLLDSSSVQLFDLSHDPSQYVYHSSGGLVYVLPADGDSTTMSFRYSICDETTVEDGGALCDTGVASVQVHTGCDEVSTLEVSYPLLHGNRIRSLVLLNWTGTWIFGGRLFLERSLGQQAGYQIISEWADPDNRTFTDTLPGHVRGDISYRWRWLPDQGSAKPGPPLRVRSRPDHRRSIFASVHVHSQNMEVSLGPHAPGVLSLVDITGREVWQISLLSTETELRVPIPADWHGYMALIWRGTHHAEGKKLIIP